jgi:hypothetical protein
MSGVTKAAIWIIGFLLVFFVLTYVASQTLTTGSP